MNFRLLLLAAGAAVATAQDSPQCVEDCKAAPESCGEFKDMAAEGCANDCDEQVLSMFAQQACGADANKAMEEVMERREGGDDCTEECKDPPTNCKEFFKMAGTGCAKTCEEETLKPFAKQLGCDIKELKEHRGHGGHGDHGDAEDDEDAAEDDGEGAAPSLVGAVSAVVCAFAALVVQ